MRGYQILYVRHASPDHRGKRVSFIRTLFLDNPLAPFLRRRFCFCFQPPDQKLHVGKDVERACMCRCDERRLEWSKLALGELYSEPPTVHTLNRLIRRPLGLSGPCRLDLVPTSSRVVALRSRLPIFVLRISQRLSIGLRWLLKGGDSVIDSSCLCDLARVRWCLNFSNIGRLPLRVEGHLYVFGI